MSIRRSNLETSEVAAQPKTETLETIRRSTLKSPNRSVSGLWSGAWSWMRWTKPLDVPAILPPTDREMYQYIRSNRGVLLLASAVSFAGAMYSTLHFLAANPLLALLSPYVGFTLLYFAISFVVNLHTGGFSLAQHEAVTAQFSSSAMHDSVDVFLPTAGEDIVALTNTWNGVRAMCAAHHGPTDVFVLDDGDRDEVRALAAHFGFRYSVRENRGWFKKAGNLRHGYELSRPLGHQFVVIFDADFRPRVDFLQELLPYFHANPRLGIVQTPQYFDVHPGQSWLERGAAAVQEFFYRFSQVARQSHDAAICVGTNAIYRRAALDDTGGTALIEHSEDVHTGFNLRMAGWDLRYVPLILAKGTCPNSMSSFFKQQYRWCMGSMSLLGSKKFWGLRMRLQSRLCYSTGFCYYIHTAITLLVAPVVPLLLLTVMPQVVVLRNYLLLIPSALYAFVLFPMWHRADYGSETWAVKHVYSWAHLVAIIDILRRRPMGWTPTGDRARKRDHRYVVFRVAQFLLSFCPSVVWVGLAAVRVVVLHQPMFLPLLFTGAFMAFTTGRVAFYRERAKDSQGYREQVGAPTVAVPALAYAAPVARGKRTRS